MKTEKEIQKFEIKGKRQGEGFKVEVKSDDLGTTSIIAEVIVDFLRENYTDVKAKNDYINGTEF